MATKRIKKKEYANTRTLARRKSDDIYFTAYDETDRYQEELKAKKREAHLRRKQLRGYARLKRLWFGWR